MSAAAAGAFAEATSQELPRSLTGLGDEGRTSRRAARKPTRNLRVGSPKEPDPRRFASLCRANSTSKIRA